MTKFDNGSTLALSYACMAAMASVTINLRYAGYC